MCNPIMKRSVVFAATLSLLLLFVGCGAIKRAGERDRPKPLLAGNPDSSAALVVHCVALLDPVFDEGTTRPGGFLSRLFHTAPKYPSKCRLMGGLLIDDAGESYPGRGRDEYLVFNKLPPGEYRLSEVVAIYDLNSAEVDAWYNCDLAEDEPQCPEYLRSEFIFPDVEDFDVTVQTGEITYWGRMLVKELLCPPYRGKDPSLRAKYENEYRLVEYDKHRFNVGDDYKIKASSKAEVKALKELYEDCRDCLWKEQLRARLDHLTKEAS